MTNDETRYREALARIAELAAGTIAAGTTSANGKNGKRAGQADPGDDLGCTVLAVPERLTDKAAETATKVNPTNAPMHQAPGAASPPTPQNLVMMTSRYWGPAARVFSVSFMEPTDADLRARIVGHMNAWSTAIGSSFVETAGVGNVRISRGPGGNKSYLGTDILLIPADRPTMNLGGFTMATADSEFYRVVRHETGHTLGFPHEHLRREVVGRIDPVKAYVYFLATQQWLPAMVDAQVLTPLDNLSIFGTPPDEDSIMCYQLPGSITRDGLPIRGGADISQTDYGFAAQVYPKLSFASQALGVLDRFDWAEAEDVLVPA